MSLRRQSRERAIQLLFSLDLNPSDNLENVFFHFWSDDKKVAIKTQEFAEELVRGVLDHRVDVDAMIKRCAENWNIKRMGVLERNIMRLAVYEMMFRPDIPPIVSINEGVDMAKYFSSNESGRFVNGVLDRARREIGRPERAVVKTSLPASAAQPPLHSGEIHVEVT
jgi:N utilization substance protein B